MNIFSQATSHFLRYGIDLIPFKFLGISVGLNPRRLDTWKPKLAHFRSNLSGWNERFLSIGGRVILINANLTNLPIYHLSFYKVPKKIIDEITSIKRNFLWTRGVDKTWIS